MVWVVHLRNGFVRQVHGHETGGNDADQRYNQADHRLTDKDLASEHFAVLRKPALDFDPTRNRIYYDTPLRVDVEGFCDGTPGKGSCIVTCRA